MIWNRLITLVSLVGGLLALLLAVASGQIVLSVVAAFFFALSVALWRYGYLFVPALLSAARIVEIRNGYEISPTRDYILKKAGDGYYAAAFLEIEFYESAVEKREEEKHLMFEAFEKTIASLKYVVKISLLIAAIDISKHIEDIKTKRSAAETRRTKQTGAQNDFIRLDREIAMWNRLLDRLTRGERPVEIVAFASTTAFGLTKEEAGGRVKRQAKEIKTILSSALGCDVSELVDLEMLRCFEWDTFFPVTAEDLRDTIF